MTGSTRRRALRAILALAIAVSTAMLTIGTPAAADVDDGTRFFVPKPNHDAVRQIARLTAHGQKADAARVREMTSTPTAVWVETGSPAQAERQVRLLTHQAAAKRTVPVLVLYNIPFRDCSQYSAGGATSAAEYRAWIDGVVRGIGDRKAVLAVEPDGLGIIPWYTNLDKTLEWCQPADADQGTAAADRFAMIKYAVQRLTALPRTSVYLDGTHNAWLNVGDISDRLLKAGVEQADGFFLNASNYQWTGNLEQYGTWISSCLAYVTVVAPGKFSDCGNQYWSGGPANNWTGVALDPAKQWSDGASDQYANTAGINSRYAAILGAVRPTASFVIDTSRNGRGPWVPTGEQASWPDPQTWCNPPGRGLGARPTTRTGTALADAYVWLKVPGESDGQCSRGLGTGNDVEDPVWGQVDPAAGEWFDRQAVELARLAVPPLIPHR